MSSLRAMIVLITCQLMYSILLYYKCLNTPGSLLYSPSVLDYLKLEQTRLSYTRAVLQVPWSDQPLLSPQTEGTRDTKPPTFCIAVVASEARLSQPQHYLLQTVASLIDLGGVGKDRRTSSFFVSMAIGDADDRASTPLDEPQSDVEIILTAGVELNLFTRTETKVGTETNAREKRGGWAWHRNEIDDYISALEKCMSDSRASHFAVIEEDVFSTVNFIDKLEAAVIELDSGGHKWSMLKLFVTDFWEGFESKPYDIFLLFLGASLVGLAALLTFKGITSRTLGFVYFFVLGLASMYFVGKQGLGLSSMARHGVYQHDMGASTLGIAYPRSVVPHVISFLKTKNTENGHGRSHRYALDQILNEFNHQNKDGVGFGVRGSAKHGGSTAAHQEKHGGQYIIVPSLLQHTGFISSSSDKEKARRKKADLSEAHILKNIMKFAADFEDVTIEWLEARTNEILMQERVE